MSVALSMEGNRKLAADSSTANPGGEVTLSGPPNGMVLVSLGDGQPPQEIKLDKDGKAKVPVGNRPRVLTFSLLRDRKAWVTVEVMDT